MNRISLYEAIQRKKEAQGLNTAPKTGPVVDPGQRAEPRVQLKQPPTQVNPASAIPVKPAVKYPIKQSLTAKSALFRKEKKNYWRFLTLLKELIKSNPTTAWMGIGGCAVLFILFIFLFTHQFGQTPDKQVAAGNNKSQSKTQRVENIAQPQTQPEKPSVPKPEKPVVAKQEDKPAVPVQRPVQTPPVETVKPQSKAQLPAVIQTQLQKQAEAEKAQPPKPVGTGDHIIVIAAYTKQDDLAPVGAYFRQNGIETEVTKQGSYYLLVTKQRFENPEKTGTDGHRMKQTIKRIGANYKAPDGYERFSSTPFQDAYGKKVK